MNYEKYGTLAHFLGGPEYKPLNLSHQSLQVVAANMKAYFEGEKTVSPDTEALEFYTRNQQAAILQKHHTKNEMLSPTDWAFMEGYTACVALQGVRLFYYLLLITTREARHNAKIPLNAEPVGANRIWKEKCVAQFGLEIYEFFKSLKGQLSGAIKNKLFKHAPCCTIGEYTKALSFAFETGSYAGGFGGIAWKNVADVLVRFVHGETSLEVLIDTAYTLAHNNGPIFNKKELYTAYTRELYKILDVQRSGQCLEYCLEAASSYALLGGNPFGAKIFAQLYPQDVGPYVDWHKVEALGALHKYPEQKKAQDAALGGSKAAATDTLAHAEYLFLQSIAENMSTKNASNKNASNKTKNKRVYITPKQYVYSVPRETI